LLLRFVRWSCNYSLEACVSPSPLLDTKCAMLGYSTTSDHQLYNVTPLKTPFGLWIGFIYNLYPHITTTTHKYLLRCVTFTQLTILHPYTGWLISYQLLSQIITHITSPQFPCLSPIETSLVEQLLNNCFLKTEWLDIPIPLI
jgi:hypothetical protein